MILLPTFSSLPRRPFGVLLGNLDSYSRQPDRAQVTHSHHHVTGLSPSVTPINHALPHPAQPRPGVSSPVYTLPAPGYARTMQAIHQTPRLPLSQPWPHLSSMLMRMSVMRGGTSGRIQPSTCVHGCSMTTLVCHSLAPSGRVKWITVDDSAAPTKPCGEEGSCRKRICTGHVDCRSWF